MKAKATSTSALANDDGAIGGNDGGGNGRHLLVDARANPAEDSKRKRTDESKTDPESFHGAPPGKG